MWRQQAWMRVMWTLQAWKETRKWRFVHHRFGRTTTKRWDGTLCSHWPGWNTSSGGNARLDDTGISTKPQVFERKSFLSKSWSNKRNKAKRSQLLKLWTIVGGKIPCPSMRMKNSDRIRIHQESSQCSNYIDHTFWAFLCYAFSLLEISTRVVKEFRDLTYESDRFPQYTCIRLSRLRNKIRVSIHCEICKIYEESCLQRGQFITLGKSTRKEFDGISQVVAHQQSRVY